MTGEVVRAEGGPVVGDEAADEAFDGLGATYALWYDVYQRDSIDDAGLPLDAVVHYGDRYDNAFWDGQRMVFGDGDGELFNRFTVALDVIGHELGHGVVETTCQPQLLAAAGRAQRAAWPTCSARSSSSTRKGETAEQADWLIGAGLLTDKVEGTGGKPAALRSMAAPGTAFDDDVLGKDPQPDHMDKFVETTQDNGGVHINSGIPNKAFHNVAMAARRQRLGEGRRDLVLGAPGSSRRADRSLPDLREGDRPRGKPAVRRRERRGQDRGQRLEGGRDRDITRL